MKKYLRNGLWLSAIAALVALSGVSVGAADGAGEITGKVTGSARYLTDAIVYLDHVPGHFPPPAQPVTMDQKNHLFVPLALPVLLGTTVRFLNNDAEAHNVYSPEGQAYDLGNWTGGEARNHTFDHLGVFTQLCHLHPSMLGYVIVLQNPFFAKVGADGSFAIHNVPPGSYQIKAWQQRGQGAPVPVTVTAGAPVNVDIPMTRSQN